MGSWYGTDALTQLAIRSGNPVRLFLMTKQKDPDFFCYSNSLYDPFGLPIRGRYDDYGSITSVKRDIYTNFLESYFQRLYSEGKIELSTDFRDDIGGGVSSKDKPATVTLEKMLHWIERGYVKIEGKRIYYMMILDRVYDRAMELANSMHEYNFSTEMDGSYRAEKEEKVKAYFDLMREEYEAEKNPVKGDDTAKSLMSKRWRVCDDLWMCEYGNMFMRFEFAEHLRDKFGNGNEKDIKDAQRLVTDYFVFKEFMNRTRKLYTPQAGGGSQDDSIHLQAELANVTLEICKSRSRDRD